MINGLVVHVLSSPRRWFLTGQTWVLASSYSLSGMMRHSSNVSPDRPTSQSRTPDFLAGRVYINAMQAIDGSVSHPGSTENKKRLTSGNGEILPLILSGSPAGVGVSPPPIHRSRYSRRLSHRSRRFRPNPNPTCFKSYLGCSLTLHATNPIRSIDGYK